MTCKVKLIRAEPKRKRVLNGDEYVVVDPKLSDLAMSRLKLG